MIQRLSTEKTNFRTQIGHVTAVVKLAMFAVDIKSNQNCSHFDIRTVEMK